MPSRKKNFQNINKIIKLIDQFEPEQINQIKKEMRLAGLRPEKSIPEMIDKIEQILKKNENNEKKLFLKYIKSILRKFQEEILSPDLMLPIFSSARWFNGNKEVEVNLVDENSDESLIYYKVIKCIQNNSFNESRPLLNHLIENGNSLYRSYYRFHLAHVFLGLNDFDNAVKEFEKVTGKLKARAQSILKTIK